MTTNIHNILNIEVSFQENTWTEITKNISIQQVLNIIKKEEYKNVIGKLRNELQKGNIEYYNSNKKRLPAVTFSGIFKRGTRCRCVRSGFFAFPRYRGECT